MPLRALRRIACRIAAYEYANSLMGTIDTSTSSVMGGALWSGEGGERLRLANWTFACAMRGYVGGMGCDFSIPDTCPEPS